MQDEPRSTIDELFDRNPLYLSDQNLDEIIVYLKDKLKDFTMTGNLTAGKMKKKTKVDKIDLGDLGL